jgi:hypothetical protein
MLPVNEQSILDGCRHRAQEQGQDQPEHKRHAPCLIATKSREHRPTPKTRSMLIGVVKTSVPRGEEFEANRCLGKHFVYRSPRIAHARFSGGRNSSGICGKERIAHDFAVSCYRTVMGVTCVGAGR